MLHININEKEHEECEQDHRNVGKKVHVCAGKTDDLSMKCYGVIDTFSKEELRVVVNDRDI